VAGGGVTPYYSDDHVTIYHGDCREIDAWLSADVLVTDPPYGRQWKQGDTSSFYGWRSNKHDGIANDGDTSARDAALALWGLTRPAIVFGDLMLEPPTGTKLVLIYDKGGDAGFTGAVAGFRRIVEAVYLIGRHATGLGGRSAVLSTRQSCGGNLARTTGHPHTKPLDVLMPLIKTTPGIIADPFMGSGSTLRAAKDLGRKAIGIEVDERYCEIAARRLAQEVLPL
jgi:site-specific DNA-methyltransferase (adenine-specific)